MAIGLLRTAADMIVFVALDHNSARRPQQPDLAVGGGMTGHATPQPAIANGPMRAKTADETIEKPPVELALEMPAEIRKPPQLSNYSRYEGDGVLPEGYHFTRRQQCIFENSVLSPRNEDLLPSPFCESNVLDVIKDDVFEGIFVVDCDIAQHVY